MDSNTNLDPLAAFNQRSTRAVNSSVELANTVLVIVKEVGEMLNNIPYVKSLSGVILQIIKIRDEIKANKERCREIIDKALRMSKWVYEKLAEIARSNQREKLARIENHLNQHERALTNVYTELEKHRSARSLFSKLTNRGVDELNAHDRHLDELNNRLVLDIIFYNTIEHAASAAAPDQLPSTDHPYNLRYQIPRDFANKPWVLKQLDIRKRTYLEEAASLTKALETYKQIQDIEGQESAAESLTLLHMSHGILIKAEKVATEYLAAAKHADYLVGEGKAHKWLGFIYLMTDRTTDARKSLEQAVIIAKQDVRPITQLNPISGLGEVYIHLDQLSAAEVLLMASVEQEQDKVQLPLIMATLGWLYVCGDRLDKAERILNDALQRFRKLNDNSCQALISGYLGTLYLKSNRLNEAERTLKSIPDFGFWNTFEIHRLWVLGDVYTLMGKLEDAEASLDAAMAQCKNGHHSRSFEQGNILRSKGIIHVKRGDVNQAIEEFKEAREFHRKAQWVSEQATDLNRLSHVYKTLGRSKEAEMAFEEAEALMETVRESRTLKA